MMKGQKATKGLIYSNKKNGGKKEVAEMKKLLVVILGLLVIGACLPGLSFAWDVTTFAYRADGSIMTATAKGGDGHLMSTTTYDSLGRVANRVSPKKEGAAEWSDTATYFYNEVTGTSRIRTQEGTGANSIDDLTYVNAYGLQTKVYDLKNMDGTNWAVYAGGSPTNPSTTYPAASKDYQYDLNGDGVIEQHSSPADIQAAGGYVAKAVSGVTADPTATGSGLKFAYLDNAAINVGLDDNPVTVTRYGLKTAFTYASSGQQTAYNFASSSTKNAAGTAIPMNIAGKPAYNGRVLFVKSMTVTGVNGTQIISLGTLPDTSSYLKVPGTAY